MILTYFHFLAKRPYTHSLLAIVSKRIILLLDEALYPLQLSAVSTRARYEGHTKLDRAMWCLINIQRCLRPAEASVEAKVVAKKEHHKHRPYVEPATGPIPTQSARSEKLHAKIRLGWRRQTQATRCSASQRTFRPSSAVHKALSIARADFEDAESAVVAIHRLASLR